MTLLVTLIFFNFVQICVQSILPLYCSSHLITCLILSWNPRKINKMNDTIYIRIFHQKVCMNNSNISDGNFPNFGCLIITKGRFTCCLNVKNKLQLFIFFSFWVLWKILMIFFLFIFFSSRVPFGGFSKFVGGGGPQHFTITASPYKPQMLPTASTW